MLEVILFLGVGLWTWRPRSFFHAGVVGRPATRITPPYERSTDEVHVVGKARWKVTRAELAAWRVLSV